MRFLGTVELGGKTATGIAVPDEVVSALGAGRHRVGLNAENRAAAGVAAGDQVDVEIALGHRPARSGRPTRSCRSPAG